MRRVSPKDVQERGALVIISNCVKAIHCAVTRKDFSQGGSFKGRCPAWLSPKALSVWVVCFPVFAARSGSRSVQYPLTAPAWKPKKEDEQSPDASKRGLPGAAADTGCLKVVSSADLHPVSLEQWGDLVFTAELTLNSSGGFGGWGGALCSAPWTI